MTPPEFVDVYLLTTEENVGQGCNMQFNECVTRAAPNDRDVSGASFGERVSIYSLLASSFVISNYHKGPSHFCLLAYLCQRMEE